MEQQGWIVLQITHVDLGAEFFNVRMLFDQQPAHMREEESSLWVVRIRIRVGEFVMHSMIAHPLDNVFLRRQRLEED